MNAMKNIAIQLSCLLCLTAVLAGCGPQTSVVLPGAILESRHVNHTRHFNAYERHALVVDGNAYQYFGRSGYKDGEFVYSLIVVSPAHGPRYIPVLRYTDEIRAQIYPSTALAWTLVTDDPLLEGEVKVADVDFNYVYFVDDGKVIFRKSNEELGIDVSDTQSAFDQSNLNLILEQMIREHVPPQETEMEEERP